MSVRSRAEEMKAMRRARYVSFALLALMLAGIIAVAWRPWVGLCAPLCGVPVSGERQPVPGVYGPEHLWATRPNREP